MKKILSILLLILSFKLGAQTITDIYVKGGIARLGSPGYGLVRITDSTYKADTVSLVSKTYFSAFMNNIVSSQWITVANKIYYTAGYVGIGDIPSFPLDIIATVRPLRIQNTTPTGYTEMLIDNDVPDAGGLGNFVIGYGGTGTGFPNSAYFVNRRYGPILFSTDGTARFWIGSDGNIGMNTTSPNASAQLDITSTTKGVLFPRLTQTLMNAVSTPASGLMITNTDSLYRPFVYTGSAWRGLAFTSETGGGGGSGITKAQLPLKVNAVGDSITRRWNVLDYLPGFVSGVTDATAGIQAAINACNAGGGGEVFFPNGIYKIAAALNSSNGQIIIPTSTSISSTRSHITLMGETKPTYLPVGGGLDSTGALLPSTVGVILKSTITSGASGAAVISAQTPVSGFNETFLTVENIAIQVKNNPSGAGPVVGGINYRYGGSLNCRNVTAYIDTSGGISVLPTNDIAGFETPDNNAETFNSFDNTISVGFKNGYIIGEHTNIVKADAWCNYYGWKFKAGTHLSTGALLHSFWNVWDITGSGNCILGNMNIDIEAVISTHWYNYQGTVYDPSVLIKGQLFYTLIQAGIGLNNSMFFTSGGSNLHCTPNVNQVVTANSTGYFKSDYHDFIFENEKGPMNLAVNARYGNSAIAFLRNLVPMWYWLSDTATQKIKLLNSDPNGNSEVFSVTQSGTAQFNSITTNTPAIFSNNSGGGTSMAVKFNSGLNTNTNFAFQNNSATQWYVGNEGLVSNDFRLLNSDANGNSNRFALSQAGALKLGAYGAGTATFDASGNITSSSDTTLKDVQGEYKSGIKELMGITPIIYKWNKKSGLEMKHTYAGFSAQNIKANIPFGTGKNTDGTLTLQDRAIMATLVNSTQELYEMLLKQQKQIEELKEEIKKLKK